MGGRGKMQREIKYKLWDTEKEFMLNCYELIFVQGGIKASDGCTTQGWVKVNKGFENKIKPTLIAIEYTGLHDKDGQEIYEGDIVRHPNGNLEKVIFINGCFQTLSTNHPNANLSLLNSYSHYIEVIGNIYENSELLNQEETN